MTMTIEREINQPTKAARPLLLKRRVSAGEVEQRSARGRSKPVAVEVRGKASPIRAWRAAETNPNQTAKQADRAPARGATTAPRQAGAGSRLSAVERAARMRAIEQAWKEERARQAELDAERQRRAEAVTRQQAEQARRQADELNRQAEAQRAAEERARLVIEQVRRFRAKAQAGVGSDQREDAAGRDDGLGHARRAKRAPARRDNRTSRGERGLSVVAAVDEGAGDRARSLASLRRQREKTHAGAAAPAAQKVARDVVVPGTITLRDLALER